MRRHRRAVTTVSVGIGAAALVYGVAAGGLPGGTSQAAGGVEPPRVPRAVAAATAGALPAFDGCEQLRRWYVRGALAAVGPWGLGGPPLSYAAGLGARTGMEPAAGTPADPVASSSTGTNVAEADVDEADVAKTDGRLVVRVSAGSLVVTDVSGSASRELSRTALPGPALASPELVLHGEHAVVVGTEAARGYGGPIVDRRGDGVTPFLGRVAPPRDRVTPFPDRVAAPRDRATPLPDRVAPPRDGVEQLVAPFPPRAPRTHVMGVDLRDPTAPRVTSDRSVDGDVVSTRQYTDGTVRVVVTTGYSRLGLVQPGGGRGLREATRLNQEVIRDAPVDAWLPGTRDGNGPRRPLLGCGDVRHPLRPSGLGTISALSFPADSPRAYDATALTASGDLAYSSADRLYVATTAGRTTTVHAFALDGPRTSYVASGVVAGTVKDRWSFSGYDGRLRVAVAVGDAWLPRQNAVVVLAERAGRLVVTGRVGGLGPGEQIRSVRWFGAVAVVVTFAQTDPLYTLDLADPRRPRLVGTLRLRGFSSYLHPVGADRLVGGGQDATGGGVLLGPQVASFDLRDPARVQRTDTLPLGDRTATPALTDPRAFTYLPGLRTLVTPVRQEGTGQARFVAVRVAPDGSLARVASWRAGGRSANLRALPLGGNRVALLGDGVRLVDVP